MMGKLSSRQDALFYNFSPEMCVPAEHLLRRIDVFLDLSVLRQYPHDYFSPTVRPSLAPDLMVRMPIGGYYLPVTPTGLPSLWIQDALSF